MVQSIKKEASDSEEAETVLNMAANREPEERKKDMKQIKIVFEGGEDEIVEKKSRFIATVRPVESEEEALDFIAAMEKKYWNATHNCSAFVVG